MGGINDITTDEWDLARKFNKKDNLHADPVNSPAHYNAGEIETIDYIIDVLGKYEAISYCHGNVIKYTSSRLWTKGKPVEDAKKAVWYLRKMIELMNDTKGVNW